MQDVKNWWNNFKARFKAYSIIATTGSIIHYIARLLAELIIAGIIVNIIASSFYPEFQSRFPAIYGFFDGGLQFGEFLCRAMLKGIYALFKGDLPRFISEFPRTLAALWHQFLSWLGNF